MAEIRITGAENPSELRAIAVCLLMLGGYNSDAFYILEGVGGLDDPKERGKTESRMRAAGLALAAAHVAPEADLPQPLDGALSTAGADQSLTAPAESPAPTPTPGTASAPAPHAVTPPSPAAPAAPLTVNPAASGSRLDARGLPWDSRVHSSGKTLLANGNWRNKGGVPPERVAAVEAELQAAMSVATSAAPPPPQPAADPLPAQAFGGVPVPPPPLAAPAPTFAALMQRITGAVTTGKLSQAAVGDAIRAVGLPSLPGLAARPDLVPAVWAQLDAILGA